MLGYTVCQCCVWHEFTLLLYINHCDSINMFFQSQDESFIHRLLSQSSRNTSTNRRQVQSSQFCFPPLLSPSYVHHHNPLRKTATQITSSYRNYRNVSDLIYTVLSLFCDLAVKVKNRRGPEEAEPNQACW